MFPFITTEGTENTEEIRIKVYRRYKISVYSVFSVVQLRVQIRLRCKSHLRTGLEITGYYSFNLLYQSSNEPA